MTISIRNVLRGTTAAVVCLSASLANASSHREAPGITEQPKVDATDFYMFRSYEPGRDGYVTIIANYQPLQAPYGGPNYFTMDPDALYEIHIDNDGDAEEEITFQFQFDNSLVNGTGPQLNIGGTDVAIPLRYAGQVTAAAPDANLGETERYSVTMVRGDRRSEDRARLKRSNGGDTFAKPLDNVGNKTIPDYAAYANRYAYNDVEIPGCGNGRVFVGQRAEGFAVNLGEVFDLVNLTPIQGPANPAWPQYTDANFNPGGIVQDRANDDLVGKLNVTSIAMEVPIDCLTNGTEDVIGGWTTASLPQAELEDPSPTYEATSVYGGAWVQQSRLSNPLVNELVIGLPDKDLFNAAEPTQDSALAVYVTNPTLPALLEVLFGAPAPTNIPRNDLVTAFLTGVPGLNQPANVQGAEMIRLNTTTAPTPRASQNTFGVVGGDLAGFPNGRRPGDDTVDIALRVVMGRLCHVGGLGCEAADAPAGLVPFTDGAPLNAADFQEGFPYLNTPFAGSPN